MAEIITLNILWLNESPVFLCWIIGVVKVFFILKYNITISSKRNKTINETNKAIKEEEAVVHFAVFCTPTTSHVLKIRININIYL